MLGFKFKLQIRLGMFSFEFGFGFGIGFGIDFGIGFGFDFDFGTWLQVWFRFWFTPRFGFGLASLGSIFVVTAHKGSRFN